MQILKRAHARIGSGIGLLALSLVSALLPAPAFAHAFGQQYTLPLPINFYIFGGGAAVFASFVILSLFSGPGSQELRFERDYRAWPSSRAGVLVLRTIGIFVLLAAIFTGFFGSQDVTKNPALFLFWVGLLLVMTYMSALISGLWQRLDPFHVLVGLVFREGYRPFATFPAWLRALPALLFYYWLIWFELLSYGAGAIPTNVALMLLVYLIIAFVGSAIFGTRDWFRYGDFFSVFFSIIGRFAPLSLEEDRTRMIWPGERLIEKKAENFTVLLFVLLGLASTAFDGLHDTTPWVRFFSAHPALETNYEALMIAVLALSPFVFLGIFALAVYLMRLITREGNFLDLLLSFAYSLVPIAIAYNVAHYFTLIVSEGQNFVGQLSDPFALGWNIFGTAGMTYNPDSLSAVTIWYVQVGAIVIGHIIATYIAHRIALREYSARWQVVLGQIPMMALMIFYTGFGLWILSLPFGV